MISMTRSVRGILLGAIDPASDPAVLLILDLGGTKPPTDDMLAMELE